MWRSKLNIAAESCSVAAGVQAFSGKSLKRVCEAQFYFWIMASPEDVSLAPEAWVCMAIIEISTI